ncbi:MAG: Rieske 2Fe-2S domain-containing protein [Gammaproteobacteria bacterium]|nr:Rieske 2Fe-2S domain-containing protein [Gammaproteobacteria bacterium]
MSDALTWLQKARPEAMQSYFAFLREAGKSLDPKTRALISVITKVDRQTGAGFRQYLKRALRVGASANEVLDALLMAFPTLGLTKILWAVDQLQQMDLPEFSLERLGGAPAWHEVSAVPVAGTHRFDCDGRGLLVHAGKSGLRVFDSRCPHESTDIHATAAEGSTLTCPKHRWVFDLETGRCTSVGDRPLRELEYKVADGRLLVYW